MIHELYLWLVPTGILIGHVGIAAKILPKVKVLDPLSRWLAHGWALGVMVAWVLRVFEVGHLPIFGTYESALSLALATVAAAIVWEHAGRLKVPISALGALTAAAIMSHGKRFDPTPYALTISERSWVVDVHAVLAWSAFAVLAVNSFFALRLILGRGEKPPELERWLVLSLQIGFVLHTAMLASGSVYKFLLFGVSWSFDPIECLGLMVWMWCGALLHMHLFAGWSGKRLARWCLGLFVMLVVSYRGIVYFPPWSTYHIFDMDLRIHVGPEELGFEGEGTGEVE